MAYVVVRSVIPRNFYFRGCPPFGETPRCVAFAHATAPRWTAPYVEGDTSLPEPRTLVDQLVRLLVPPFLVLTVVVLQCLLGSHQAHDAGGDTYSGCIGIVTLETEECPCTPLLLNQAQSRRHHSDHCEGQDLMVGQGRAPHPCGTASEPFSG